VGGKGSCGSVMGSTRCVAIGMVGHAVKAEAGANWVLQTAQRMLTQRIWYGTARSVYTGVPGQRGLRGGQGPQQAGRRGGGERQGAGCPQLWQQAVSKRLESCLLLRWAQLVL